MNIIGEGFHENIITEISRRHEIHGYRANQGININVFNSTVPKILDYLNSRTGWVKMISSVDIKDINEETIEALTIPIAFRRGAGNGYVIIT